MLNPRKDEQLATFTPGVRVYNGMVQRYAEAAWGGTATVVETLVVSGGYVEVIVDTDDGRRTQWSADATALVKGYPPEWIEAHQIAAENGYLIKD